MKNRRGYRQLSEVTMKENIAGQYQFEIDTWLRLLDYLRQENIFLKNRLAEVVKTADDAGLLDKAENFQNSFLNKDTVMSFIRRDIKSQAYAIENGKILNNELAIRQAKLRRDMTELEKAFNGLKQEFNNYILEEIN